MDGPPAKERDTESGLDEFGARYYASSLGRFTIPDWAAKPTAVPYAHYGNPQSLNLYGYVQNNPTTFGDPDGHVGPETLIDIGEEIATYVAAHPAEVQAVADEAAAGASASRYGVLAGVALYVGEMINPSTTVGGDKEQGQQEQEHQEKEAEPQTSSSGAGARRGNGNSGTIYKVPGEATQSGKPYIGRHNKPDPAKTRKSNDGRDRTKAEVVDKYNAANTQEGRAKEQQQIDQHGLQNLDNKRNEIRKGK